MCGIVYVKRFDGKIARKQVIKRYHKQKDRGEDGYGYLTIDPRHKVSKVHRFQFEHEAKAALERSESKEILLHHRFPTSTPNLVEATHPIVVSHDELEYDYYVVHNGVITNDDSLKDKHEKLGYKYTTELFKTYKTSLGGITYNHGSVYNDSEALAIELARTIEGKQKVANAEGAIAYIALQTTKGGKAVALYYGTNGRNPLCVTLDKQFIAIASEGGRAIAAHTHYKYVYASGAVEEVPELKLAGYNTPAYSRPGYSYVGQHTASSLSAGWDDDMGAYGKHPRSDDMDERSAEADLWELEQQLEEVESDLDFAKSYGKQAMENGDAEEEDAWKSEIKALEARRRDLETTIQKLALAIS